ncbi:MAG: ferritin-like domain-containing protein [Solirubrobacteraceae bacterium]
MNNLNFELLDIDGAVRETGEAAGFDRSDFLKKGAIAGGGLIAGGAMFGPYLDTAEAAISRRKSKRNDIKILNFALTLEMLEAEFYRLANSNRVYGTNAPLQRYTEWVAGHERQHVRALEAAIREQGGRKVGKPDFQFGDAVTDVAKYRATAQLVEDVGVRAYLGQASRILQPALLKAAGSILATEARHASWIRFLNTPAVAGTPEDALPAPRTFDKPASERATRRKAGEFIK